MSDFSDLLDMADDVIDQIAAEPFVLNPQTGTPNVRSGRDKARPIINGYGVFGEQTLPSRPGGSIPVQTLAIGKAPFFDVNSDAFQGILPAQGDLIELPERGRAFTIIGVAGDGSSRLRLTLASAERRQ